MAEQQQLWLTSALLCVHLFLGFRCRAEKNTLDIAYERLFPTPYTNSPLFLDLLQSVARQKNGPDTADSFRLSYDYIVVGAGTAGSVVAARLSEIPTATVLLLEAGGHPPYQTDVPVTAEIFFNTAIDWNYTTVPQKHTSSGFKNNQVPYHKGKVLGGSSIHNGMLYVRGNREDYDGWERGGAKGWSYKEVLPYFRKSEGNRDVDRLLNGFHGALGPLTVERPLMDTPLKSAIYRAGLESGYPIGDSNGVQQIGYDDFQGTLRNQQRCSTAKAFLVPVENRRNIDIVTNAHVMKIIIKNKRAEGVEFLHKNKLCRVRARKEVILSAGTVNSAKVLMLSGIGPKEHLQQLGIDVLADLPVGNNLQDHCSTVISFTVNNDTIPRFDEAIVSDNNIRDYIKHRKGPLASTGGIFAIAFLKNNPQASRTGIPDYQSYWLLSSVGTNLFAGLSEEVYNQVYAKYSNSSFYGYVAQLLHPKSRGTVRLSSKNPLDDPLIDPNYLAHPQDVADMVAAMKTGLAIGNSAQLEKFESKVFDTVFPGCEKYVGNLNSSLECQLKVFVQSVYHDVGTCKMGNPDDNTTVLDPRLCVKGIGGLRVVDASVMPTIVSSNTYASTVMIAEKGSDMIKRDYRSSLF